MVIFYDPSTFEIKSHIAGFDDNSQFSVKLGNQELYKIIISDQHFLHEWAREFDNPENPKNPLDYKIVMKNNKIVDFALI